MRVILELTTDGFVGGARPNDDVDLRPPSIQGALRFFWRACRGDLQAPRLHQREAELFGSTSSGQGLRLRVVRRAVTRYHGAYRSGVNAALPYLGYGIVAGNGSFQRGKSPAAALAAGSQVELELTPGGSPGERALPGDLLDALWLLGAIGGVGARSRRGFGSVQIAGSTHDARVPWPARCATPQDLADAWARFLDGLSPAPPTPPWTAVGPRTRVLIGSTPHADWKDALEEVGRELKTLRMEYGSASGRDRPIVRAMLSGTPKTAPHRAAFGLPHPYYFKSRRLRLSFEADGPGTDRRASPVLLHVTRLADGRHVPVAAWLPAQFLPRNARVVFRSKGKRPVDPPSEIAITDFLDRLGERGWKEVAR